MNPRRARMVGEFTPFRPPLTLLLAAVGVTLAIELGTFDFTEPARQRDVLLGVLKGCALAGAYTLISLSDSGKSRLLISRKDEVIFLLFAGWIALTLVGLTRGIALGNNVRLLLGDLFRFLEVPAIFAAAYFASRTIHDIYAWCESLLLLWLTFTIGELIFFLPELLQGSRLTSFSVEMSLFIFLFSVANVLGLTPREPSKYGRVLVFLGLGMSIIVLLIGQSRNTVVKAILGAGMLLAFGLRYHGLRRRHLRLLALSGFFVLVAVLGFRASASGFLVRVSEVALLGVGAQGSRIPEALSLLRLTVVDPTTLFFGSGLGSVYLLDSVYSVYSPSQQPQHFVHSSVAEVFFRLGVFGVVAFVAVWLSFLSRTFKLLRSDIVYAFPFVVAFLSIVGLLTITFNPFVSAVYILPLFGGIFRSRGRRESRQSGQVEG